jgi:hypothetical protein
MPLLHVAAVLTSSIRALLKGRCMTPVPGVAQHLFYALSIRKVDSSVAAAVVRSCCTIATSLLACWLDRNQCMLLFAERINAISSMLELLVHAAGVK